MAAVLTRGEKISAGLKHTNRRKRVARASAARFYVRRAKEILTALGTLSVRDVVEVYYANRAMVDGARSVLQ